MLFDTSSRRVAIVPDVKALLDVLPLRLRIDVLGVLARLQDPVFDLDYRPILQGGARERWFNADLALNDTHRVHLAYWSAAEAAGPTALVNGVQIYVCGPIEALWRVLRGRAQDRAREAPTPPGLNAGEGEGEGEGESAGTLVFTAGELCTFALPARGAFNPPFTIGAGLASAGPCACRPFLRAICAPICAAI